MPATTAVPSVTFAPAPNVTVSAVTPTSAPRPAVLEPRGFPIDPATRLVIVASHIGTPVVAQGAQLDALTHSRDYQASGDPTLANQGGWNCRVHQEYEARPAVDWYIPTGTPIVATLDGLATLYVISVPNAFEFYDVNREPYIGNPDRSRAPLSPFLGPGGGKGVYVEIANGGFVTEYAHLDIGSTLAVVPEGAFLPGYSRTFDYIRAFGTMRAFNDATAVARWQVRAGEVVGHSGDSGYSEAPHLHYTVRRANTSALLCPTNEAGFPDGGWLFR